MGFSPRHFHIGLWPEWRLARSEWAAGTPPASASRPTQKFPTQPCWLEYPHGCPASRARWRDWHVMFQRAHPHRILPFPYEQLTNIGHSVGDRITLGGKPAGASLLLRAADAGPDPLPWSKTRFDGAEERWLVQPWQEPCVFQQTTSTAPVVSVVWLPRATNPSYLPAPSPTRHHSRPARAKRRARHKVGLAVDERVAYC